MCVSVACIQVCISKRSLSFPLLSRIASWSPECGHDVISLQRDIIYTHVRLIGRPWNSPDVKSLYNIQYTNIHVNARAHFRSISLSTLFLKFAPNVYYTYTSATKYILYILPFFSFASLSLALSLSFIFFSSFSFPIALHYIK